MLLQKKDAHVGAVLICVKARVLEDTDDEVYYSLGKEYNILDINTNAVTEEQMLLDDDTGEGFHCWGVKELTNPNYSTLFVLKQDMCEKTLFHYSIAKDVSIMEKYVDDLKSKSKK